MFKGERPCFVVFYILLVFLFCHVENVNSQEHSSLDQHTNEDGSVYLRGKYACSLVDSQ